MAGKLEGKVAFITGAARGQGRSHAIRLAQEGADIIAVDICAQIGSVAYPMATPQDLAETVKEVEALDRRIVARQADVRDEAGLKAAFDAGVAELGPVDIVLANAGIAPMTLGEEPHEAWQDVIDVNLTGVFNTVEIAIPSMIERRSRSTWSSRRTSPTRSSGWSPTTPATSPASPCRSTRDSPTRSKRGWAMAGRVAGKVAFITGAARGQGRSHAIRLAEEGADIIAVDICRDYGSVPYPLATEADLAETVKAVEALDRRIVATVADVRDVGALKAAVDDGVAQLGRLDVVSANAGICTIQSWDEVTPEVWQDTLDTNLTGVWNTMVVSVPHLIAAGGGSIICTSSTAGIKGLPYLAPYVAAKHGVVGISRTMANELARHNIRVNTVHPTGVDTPMGNGLGGLEPLIGRDPNLGPIFMNTLPVEIVDSRDISNAVLFLASDEARYVTGLEFTVDAGNTIR